MKFYGNGYLIENLKEMVTRKKVAHCYLFYGEKGVGKKDIAKFFARAIFCERENAPCGSCSSCLKFKASNHPDFLEIGKEGLRQSFGVLQVRKIIEKSYITANDGEFKIFLLNDVDDLLPVAANALLKILEEPPCGVVFILTAKNKNSVLKTILSRCFCFFVAPSSFEECYTYLKTLDLNFSDSKMRKLCFLSQGKIGKLKEYATTEEGLKILDISKNLISYFLENSELKFLSILQRVEKDQKLVLKILDCFLTRLLMIVEMQKNLDYESILKIYKVSDLLQNSILNIKRGANLGICLAKFCCEIFG